jgi:hypothetical protein
MGVFVKLEPELGVSGAGLGALSFVMEGIGLSRLSLGLW